MTPNKFGGSSFRPELKLRGYQTPVLFRCIQNNPVIKWWNWSESFELCAMNPQLSLLNRARALVSLAVVGAHPELFARLVAINVPIFPERLPNRGMRSLSYLPRELIQIADHLRLPYLFAPLVRAIVRVERREVLVDWSAVTPEEVYWITYTCIYLPSVVTKLT